MWSVFYWKWRLVSQFRCLIHDAPGSNREAWVVFTHYRSMCIARITEALIRHCTISIWGGVNEMLCMCITCCGCLSLSIWLESVGDVVWMELTVPLKATLGNESRAACQIRLAASLTPLSNTCWSSKYESPIVWFSSYSVIKGWCLVKWLARWPTLQS